MLSKKTFFFIPMFFLVVTLAGCGTDENVATQPEAGIRELERRQQQNQSQLQSPSLPLETSVSQEDLPSAEDIQTTTDSEILLEELDTLMDDIDTIE